MDKDQYLDEILKKAKDASSNNKDPIVVALLDTYLEHRDHDNLAWFLYGDALRIVGRFKESKHALMKAVEKTSSDKLYGVQVRFGMLQKDMGNYKEAEEWLAKATQSKEGKVLGWIWVLRGINLAKVGDFSSAENCYKKALELDDVDIDEAYLNMGYVLRAQGKYNDARVAFNKALSSNPEYTEAVEALNSIQDIEEVIKFIKKIPPK